MIIIESHFIISLDSMYATSLSELTVLNGRTAGQHDLWGM